MNLLQIQKGERITTAIAVKDFKEGYLVMFTKKGIVKKTALQDFSNPRGKGVIAINIDDGDELIAVRRTSGINDLLIGTRSGLSVRFREEDVRPMGRSARGVIGIRLIGEDEVVSAEVVQDRTTVLTVTERGYGKRTRVEEYPVHKRGGKGVISIKVNEKIGKAVGLLQVREDDEIVMITNAGKLIRTSVENISQLGRNTMGVKLMNVDPDDSIVSLGRVAVK